jgi:hypothetical protein
MCRRWPKAACPVRRPRLERPGTTGGTPAAVIERLNREANAALAAPDVRKRLKN